MKQYFISATKTRVYNKELACKYCGSYLRHRIQDHLITCHGDEQEVASATASAPAEKKLKFMFLKNEGNFKNNVKFLKDGTGKFIVARRS
jgi:hypothetical protein